MSAVNNRKAFTLVEVIVILVVIGILAALAVPAALRLFEVTAEETTRQEMDNIKRAILGDARKLQSSFRSDFGYIGDIGCLPDDLQRIFTNSAPPLPSALPTWTFDSTKQTGAGWKGPYISGAASGQETDVYTKDEWGSSYTYTPVGGACPLTATLTSPAANIASATDDITISISATETTATVRGKVKDITGAGLAGISVELYSSVGGVLTTTTATTSASGEYVFTSVPFGPRAVRALPPARLFLVPGSAVAETFGGDPGRNVVFKIVNYSASAITITTITASWIPPTDRYDDLFINQSNVDDSPPAPNNNFDSGEVVDITDTAIAANPNPSASMRVFIDSPDTQLPDINLSSGTTATIELQFEGGDDLRGRPFTVVFAHTGGPSTVTFIP
jgi:prepilin-type N-terminal cleavage/methylation domain-containing protein